MAKDFFKKIFGSKNERLLKSLWPLVEQINQLEESYQSLSEAELVAKTDDFRERIKNGETTDDIMLEAFAVVKNACRRMFGTEIEITGNLRTWDMIPFDVQVIGAIVLHRGNIAEMATGEGKTLVATMPLYLNALTGRNCQLVTVNDYLARRDAEWMGAIYKYLGLTVGCIQQDMSPAERREQYGCDITYGTNAQLGFDYLRDMGMATEPDQVVQRNHFYVIIDEIDSILIDEARTPLIISGPATVSTHKYDKLKPIIERIFKKQSQICTNLIQEAREILLSEEEQTEETIDGAVLKACLARMGMPKQKQLMRLLEDPGIRKRLEKKEALLHSDNNRGYLQQVREELFFTIDERGGESDLTNKGRNELEPNDPDAFVMPDLASELSEIDGNDSIDDEEKLKLKEKAQRQFEEKSETLHNISQLLRAYCLFECDRQYVVQENKVIIVDEFTGRLMPGRRFSEGLHQALEAKEDVHIEGESQTLASITIQNYFRQYEKLAGMTGTAETEANEFKEIYDLDVTVIPTNRPCIRIDEQDKIYKTKREKYNAIAEEITECNKQGQPVLLGTVSVDVSETLSRILRRQRIPHNVLNAKNHQHEAEIVTRAGQKGAVTIATNMAGRGTDIKLGEGVREAGGLRVIASERHDSRRIDRQLRGRCSRQGDPGASRFYVSLEDDLMRLFGSEKITGIMERMGLQEGEELSHGMLSRTIEKAQRRVEERHFEARKRTLEYDDVISKQRQVIYNLRHDILMTEDSRTTLFDFVYTTVIENLEEMRDPGDPKSIDREAVLSWLNHTFPITFEESIFDVAETDEAVAGAIVNHIEETYKLKENAEDPRLTRWLEREIMLHVIDKNYREHLYAVDNLREGIQLQAYAQKDPLIQFKQEAYGIFSGLMNTIKQEILEQMFRSIQAVTAMESAAVNEGQLQEHSSDTSTQETPTEEADERPKKLVPVRRTMPKVGRNDPCPCGSGKKFKQCCGK